MSQLLALLAVTAIGLAYLANIVFKLGMIGVAGGAEMLRRCLAGMVMTAAGTIVGLLLFA